MIVAACSSEEYTCGDGSCSFAFDVVAVCSSEEYTCDDGSCVVGGDSVRCDRKYDCQDGSDENSCGKLTVP